MDIEFLLPLRNLEKVIINVLYVKKFLIQARHKFHLKSLARPLVA